MAKGKPLMVGDAIFDAERIESYRNVEASWDRSYVPGYGEKRRENELRVRSGKKAIPMPRLQWLRVSRLGNEDVDRKDMLEWALLGYRFVNEEDLESLGFEMPPTAHVDAGGLIRREDLALAFVDAEQAARNAERQAAINAGAMGRPRGGSIEESKDEQLRHHGDVGEFLQYVEDD